MFGLQTMTSFVQTLDLQSTQTTSSASTPLFKMIMEYRILYDGGDTVVRVMHDSNVENYQFQIGHTVTGVVVDPFNHVLDGLAETKKSTGEETMAFSLSPNPNHGSFRFRMEEMEELDDAPEYLPVRLEVYSTTGQLVHNATYEGCLPYMDYTVELNDPARGLYIARFTCGQHVSVLKMMVE